MDVIRNAQAPPALIKINLLPTCLLERNAHPDFEREKLSVESIATSKYQLTLIPATKTTI